MQHACVTWILYIVLIHPFSYQKVQGLLHCNIEKVFHVPRSLNTMVIYVKKGYCNVIYTCMALHDETKYMGNFA
jgi:hypothetical protein